MSGLAGAKAEARATASGARAAAHAAGPGAARRAAAHALMALAGLRGVKTVAGYLPIRSEIDPRPAMRALHGLGYRVVVPVVEAADRPLGFRTWTPGVATARGPFGVEVPMAGEAAEPDLLLVPLLAYDPRGHRLGYGGGFYDRTIAALRARGDGVLAFGFAYAAQEVSGVPDGEDDMRLDGIVTERGFLAVPAG